VPIFGRHNFFRLLSMSQWDSFNTNTCRNPAPSTSSFAGYAFGCGWAEPSYWHLAALPGLDKPRAQQF